MKERLSIITGFGHCGSSFFMRVLTDLGVETGFKTTDEEESRSYEFFDPRDLRAWCVAPSDLPGIIKSPQIAIQDGLEEVLPSFDIDHVTLLMRDPEDHHRRGYWSAEESLERYGKFIWSLTRLDISFSTVHYPRIVDSPGYMWRYAQRFLDCSEQRFMEVHEKVVRPDLVARY